MLLYIFCCLGIVAVGFLLARAALPALGLGMVAIGLTGLVALCTVVAIWGHRLVEAGIVSDTLSGILTSSITFIALGIVAIGTLLFLYMVDNSAK